MWKAFLFVAAIAVASYTHGVRSVDSDVKKAARPRVSGHQQMGVGVGDPDIFWSATDRGEYIRTYATYAQELGAKNRIPPSIIIAAGILESAAGGSFICKKTANHFGLKCRKQNKCPRRGSVENAGDLRFHCIKFSDGYFLQFPNGMRSFLGYAERLSADRYFPLKEYYGQSSATYAGHGCDSRRKGWERKYVGRKMAGYECFAHGLEAAGYANGEQYGEKLCRVITENELWRLD